MDFGSAGHRRISCQSAFNRRSLNSAPWRAHAHTHVRCVCVHKRSYAKFVNGEQFEGSRRRRGGEGNFGPRGPTSPPPPPPRRGADSPSGAANTNTAKIFARTSSLLPAPPLISSPSLLFSFALPLPWPSERSSSGTHHTTHSGEGLCIATGPGNISFRKITGSRRGCQCIKQTSLRQPYT